MDAHEIISIWLEYIVHCDTSNNILDSPFRYSSASEIPDISFSILELHQRYSKSTSSRYNWAQVGFTYVSGLKE